MSYRVGDRVQVDGEGEGTVIDVHSPEGLDIRFDRDSIVQGWHVASVRRVPTPDGETLSAEKPTRRSRRRRDLPAIGTVAEDPCYECGADKPVVVRERIKAQWGESPEVDIEVEWYKCPKCGEGFYTFEQSQAHERELWRATITAHRAEAIQLRSDLATARAALARWEGLRRAVAELIGTDPETWPDHGNAPLAIASHIALTKLRDASPEPIRDPSDEKPPATLTHGTESVGATQRISKLHKDVAAWVRAALRAANEGPEPIRPAGEEAK